MLTQKKLYTLLLAGCGAGYAWIAYSIFNLSASNEESAGICLFKHATNIPCPSCGTTRSVISLLEGNFMAALWINPLGLIAAIILLVTPIWIFYDRLMNKSTLFDFYLRMEKTFQKPWMAIPAATLILLNWIWSISKGL
jgi:hypothetical protein